MTTVRIQRKGLILQTALAILLLGFISTLAYPMIRGVFSPFLSGMWIASLLGTTFMLMICVLVVFFIVAGWFYHIDFNDTFIEEHTIGTPFRKAFKCAYADIATVKKIAQGQIAIVSHEGKILFLIPKGYEGGEAFLFDVLEQHIPAERFEPGLRNNYKQVERSINIITTIAMVSLLLAACLMVSQNSLVPLPLGWNYFRAWRLPFNSISGVSIESSNSVWIASQNFSADEITIEHIAGSQTQTWYIPNDDEFKYLNKRILVNSQQQPVLVTGQSIHFLKDGQWQKQGYGKDYQSLFSSITNIAILANEYWISLDHRGAMNNEKLFVHIQADTPQPTVIKLIDPTTQKTLAPQRAEIAADGTPLLLENDTVYSLRNGAVQQHYSFTNTNNNTYVSDFTMSDDGNVYALLNAFDSEAFVGRIGQEGKSTVTQLPSFSQQNGPNQHYRSIQVDAYGRLWVAGAYPDFVKILEPVWGGVAHEIVTYDSYNSNYENDLDVHLLRTTDGRIWAAKNHLIWMDSNARELPRPLPEWLAQMRHIEIIGPAQIGFNILAVILTLIVAQRQRKKTRQNLPR